MKGNSGKIIRIDLTKKECGVMELKEEVFRSFIGGTGLAAYLYSRYCDKNLSSLDPKSPLIFTTGPFVGTDVPTSGRFAVGGRSPLTNLWGDSDCGGKWGPELKKTGYDGLIIEGKSDKPIYILINDDKVEFIDAATIWGKDTYDTYYRIQNGHKEKPEVVCIGPAGENQVLFASIMTEGVHGRAAGRCGFGATMGSKNLKAIAVKGSREVPVFNGKELKQSIKEALQGVVDKTKRRHLYGSAGGVVGNAAIGDSSANNWRDGDWLKEAEKVGGEVLAEKYLTGYYYCPKCFIGCGRVVKLPDAIDKHKEVGGPEYETIAGFGGQCLMSDLAEIIKANDICNRLGIDTITASGVISFALEAKEKGVFREKDTESFLKWGDSRAILSLLEAIAYKKGIGERLALGVKRLSEELGPETRHYAIHVKGLELPLHDPRAISSLAVSYATHGRGACHRGCTHEAERNAFPELGIEQALDRFAVRGKGKNSKIMQDYAELFNSLKLCQFILSNIKPSTVLKWLNLCTGWDMNLTDFVLCGERNNNLKRMINFSLGMKKDEDTLPGRILTEAFPTGGAKGHLPQLDVMLQEYYSSREWGPDGLPTQAKIKELGLDSFKQDLL